MHVEKLIKNVSKKVINENGIGLHINAYPELLCALFLCTLFIYLSISYCRGDLMKENILHILKVP